MKTDTKSTSVKKGADGARPATKDTAAQETAGIESAADLPKITEALMLRGYTDSQLRKMLGGNLLRVFRDVQDFAARAASE